MYSTQGKTLIAVTDVIRVWFIIVYCVFAAGSVKFLQLCFVSLLGKN